MEERHRQLLVKNNPWWQGIKSELPKFERDLLKKLHSYVKCRQIIAIVGLRRVGKTVLMKQIIQKLTAPTNNICYISFDDIEFQNYRVAEELINYFLEFSDGKKMRFLFLDEIQKLPGWSDLLKTYYDTENNLKMFVSGSASLEIKKQKETLAGRIFSFHLPVMSFSEFARYFNMPYEIQSKNMMRDFDVRFSGKKEGYKKLFEKYMKKGAFPELLDTDDEEFIKKYIKESVIEKAVSDASKISGENENVIYELFKLLAGSNAQLFEITNLSDALKINRNTISKCIGLLEKAFLIKISYNFTASVAKQVRTNKKQYCAHSSIVVALLDYPFSSLSTEISGYLAEAEIANSIENAAFWRTPQKDEVDIIVKDEKPLPIEVKYKSNITGSDMDSVLKFCRKFNAKRGIIVTKDISEKRNIEGIEILLIPAWAFLLLRGLHSGI